MKKPEIRTGNKYSTNGAAQSGYLHLEECNTYHLYKTIPNRSKIITQNPVC